MLSILTHFLQYSIYSIIPAIAVGFYYLDGVSIVKNNVVVKYRKFRKINRLVATNYKGIFTILWISLCMVAKALWISFIQYVTSSVTQIDKNKYAITYMINGRLYKTIVKTSRGPRKIILVSDENQDDISHLIFQYLGPEENFHNEIFTPSFFNKKELIFEMSDGSEKIFKENECISVV